MHTYPKMLRLAGWAVIVFTALVVILGNALADVNDPNRCPVGLTCSISAPGVR